MGRNRIIFLKTAIESLTGTSDTLNSAKVLTEMFRRVPVEKRSDLLWREDEPSFPKNVKIRGADPQPALIHFVSNFAFQRNQIIHEGIATTHIYVQAGSAYEGHFVDVADRIVREAILVALEECGHPDLWRSARHRELSRAIADGCIDFDGLVYNVTETLTEDGWRLTVKELPEITATVDDTSQTVEVTTEKIAAALGVSPDTFAVYALPEIRPAPNDLIGATGEPVRPEECREGGRLSQRR